MVSAEEFDCIVNARWHLWHAGKWCPVVNMFVGKRETKNPLHANMACAYTGDPDGQFMVIEVAMGDILARTPGCAPDWMPWHEVARIRAASGRPSMPH